MKKVLVIISGGLPIPAIKGGAVETLIDMYINANEKLKKYKFEVYSTYCDGIEEYSKKYKYTKFNYIKTNKFFYQISRLIRAFMHKVLKLPVEFKFIHEVIKDICYNNKQYDLIIVENNASLVIPLYKKFGNKIILHLHNDNVNNKIQDGIETYNDCKRIYAVSDYIKERCETCGENIGKVITLFNGINQDELTMYSNSETRKEIRAKYNIKNEDVVFIFSGRICDDKGVKELLIAFNNFKMHNNAISAKLMIVGASFFSAKKPTKYVKKLIDIAKSNKDDIIFTGYIKHCEMGKVYSASDVQVIPSKFDDPCPLTVLEGMTMGLPQIACKCGGIPEEVSEDNAILVERKNIIEELEFAMKKMYNDKNLREHMGIFSKKRASMFKEEQYIENFYKLLDKEF